MREAGAKQREGGRGGEREGGRETHTHTHMIYIIFRERESKIAGL